MIYRGLKPEHVLLSRNGHIKLTDFGHTKLSDSRKSTVSGSPLYFAPEIIQAQVETKAVDFWALGVLAYEMMVGENPFISLHSKQIYKRILQRKFSLPEFLSDDAKDLINKLIDLDPLTRLGSGVNGIEDIKNHPFFESIDWNDVNNKNLIPPHIPKIRSESDTEHVDELYKSKFTKRNSSFFCQRPSETTYTKFEDFSYYGTEQEGSTCRNSENSNSK